MSEPFYIIHIKSTCFGLHIEDEKIIYTQNQEFLSIWHDHEYKLWLCTIITYYTKYVFWHHVQFILTLLYRKYLSKISTYALNRTGTQKLQAEHTNLSQSIKKEQEGTKYQIR